MTNSYLSRAVLACFEGEDAAAATAAAAASGPGGRVPIQAGPDGRFSQENLNTALANDRRKHQAKLEKTIQDMQANANLTAAEHEALAERLEEVQKEGRRRKPIWPMNGNNWRTPTKRS